MNARGLALSLVPQWDGSPGGTGQTPLALGKLNVNVSLCRKITCKVTVGYVPLM